MYIYYWSGTQFMYRCRATGSLGQMHARRRQWQSTDDVGGRRIFRFPFFNLHPPSHSTCTSCSRTAFRIITDRRSWVFFLISFLHTRLQAYRSRSQLKFIIYISTLSNDLSTSSSFTFSCAYRVLPLHNRSSSSLPQTVYSSPSAPRRRPCRSVAKHENYGQHVNKIFK